MTQEKDAFGFYLSAHPVDRYRHLLAANGVRSFAALAEARGPVGGGRTSASMAALVEESRWRTSACGKRYLLATCSDDSGQFIASIFDYAAQPAVAASARNGDGTPVAEAPRLPPHEEPAGGTRTGPSPI